MRQHDAVDSTFYNWINCGTETCGLAVIWIHANPVQAGGRPMEAFG